MSFSILDISCKVVFRKSSLRRQLEIPTDVLINSLTIYQLDHARTFYIKTIKTPEVSHEVLATLSQVFTDTLKEIYDTDSHSIFVVSVPRVNGIQAKSVE